MSKTKVFIFFGISYLFGILLNNFTKDIYITLIIYLVLVLVYALFFYVKKIHILILFFSLLGLLLGIFISDHNYSIIKEKVKFIYSMNEKEKLDVEINNIDKITDEKTIYIGKLLKVNGNNVNKNINIQVFLNGNYKLEKGSIINFEAKIYNFFPSKNFAYDRYMYSQNIFFKVYPYSYEKTGDKNSNFITKNISNFREKILSDIKQLYTYEEGIFLGGILVGARESMPTKLGENFNNSGLTHLIAVSGFNITILVIFFGYIVMFFPPIIRFSLITIILVLFTMLVGYNPPVIRATIMGVIGYFILISGRKGNSLAIIILTAILMVSYSSLSLTYDVSFHLSFLAVLGILYCQKPIENFLKFIPNFLEIRTALSITLAALIFTFPVMIFNFGQLSIISPISNILVSWTIPIIMLLSFIGLVLYNLLSILGIIFSFIPWILLKWDILIVNVLGSYKYSTLQYDFGKYSELLEFLCLLLLFCFLIYTNKRSSGLGS